MPTKTRTQPTKAARPISVPGIGSETRTTHPSLTTWLQKKRSENRPSTPKGVGREAPLTAGSRGAKNAVRSAGITTTRTNVWSGRGRGRNRGLGVHSDLALRCGWRRPPAADHPQSPLTLNMSGNWWWSAAGGLGLAGGPGGSGRGPAGSGRVGSGVGMGVRGRKYLGTKQGRCGGWLRLGCGWRSA